MEKKCLRCGKIYTPKTNHPNNKYCSYECLHFSKCEICGTKIRAAAKRCLNCREKKHSEETKRKIGLANRGKNNGQWKEIIGYTGLHWWVRTKKPKPDFCERCGKVPPYDLANKGIYDRNFDNWEWLCRRCHMEKDGRMDKFKSLSRSRKGLKSDEIKEKRRRLGGI